VGKVGKAQPHAAYIARQGQYAHRLECGEKLEAVGVGNLPAWAQHDPLIFWQAADTNERANGSTYREYEIALPRELLPDQRKNLLEDFVKCELGDKYVYQYAIHNPKALDGQEQPHAHLMFCERRLDGIERDPDQFFKRYNAKHPERGGAKKENTGKDFATRQAELKQLRQRWEHTCNDHLERAGSEQRIDMRSYQERGLDQAPEPKPLPSQWRKPETQAALIELRQARRENDNAQQVLRQAVPDLTAEITHLAQKPRSTDQVKADYETALTHELALLRRQQEAEHQRLQALQEQLVTEKAVLSAAKPPPPVHNTKTSRLFKKVADTLLGGNYAEYEQSVMDANQVWEHKKADFNERVNRFEQDADTLESAAQRVAYLAAEQVKAKQPQLAKDYEKAQALEREKAEQERQREREAREKERQAEREQREQRRKSRNNDRGFSR
jgi:hypothetical protein